MTLLACAHAAAWFALVHIEPPAAPEPRAWRLVDTPSVHVGLRPAAANEGTALTLQITVRTPF